MAKSFAGFFIVMIFTQMLSASTIFTYDFNGANSWPSASTDVLPSTPVPVEPSIAAALVGTVDIANTSTKSGGMLLSVEVGTTKDKWEAIFDSGLLVVKNQENQLGQLTLAFDLSASMARPVMVRLSSFNAQKKISGTLEGMVLPAAPDFYQRFAMDLSSMHPYGQGKFDPADPFVQIEFAINGSFWPGDATHKLMLDNVHYASPAFYVSPKGNDQNDGRSEDHPLADPQQAIDLAKPGDIVLLMEGEYRRGKHNTVQDGIVAFRHAGAPAAWITLKNFPGQQPVFRSDAWHTVQIRRSKADSVQADPVLAYLEVRGLHVIGFVDEVKKLHPELIGKVNAESNQGGFTVNGDDMEIPPHHIRFADNLVERCCGGGMGSGNADWVTFENNVSRDNCWTTIYAPSGISVLGWRNFDTQDNVYKWLVRNNVTCNNRTYVAWKAIGRVSDGNGIIVDTNVAKTSGEAFLGRTLVQNNVSYNNGGSGIHSFRSHRVDIVNNTAYLNGASPELAWGQIFLQRTDDARVINNILYARDGQPVNTVSKDLSDKGNTHVVRANNIYFGGGFPPIVGQNDLVANPLFVNPQLTLNADFRLKSDSPAMGHGRWDPVVPLFDIRGHLRPLNANPDAGAYQH